MERIKFLCNIIAIVFAFSFMGTACGKLDVNKVSDSPALESIKISEVSAKDTLTSEAGKYTEEEEVSDNSTHNSSDSESVKTSELSTSDNSELVEYTEKQIVTAICIELYDYDEKDALELADYMMNIAETLSETSLGSIVSEEDAIQKARSILIEIAGAEFIEMIESDFVELNGEKIKYRRTNSPYNVTFYEEYNVWLIDPNLPLGITEDDSPVMTPGITPYVVMRGDGKILAVFH